MRDRSSSREATIAEEVASSAIHGIGAGLAVAGLVVLIAASSGRGVTSVVAASVFGSALVVLFLCSTVYHAVGHEGAKGVLRRLDHGAIYLLIAASYTPFALVALRGAVGWWLAGTVWALTATGIVLTVVAFHRTRAATMVLYVASGWCVVVAAGPILRALDPLTLGLMVGGGLAYTSGLVFYAWRARFAHAVWHLFVLAGAGLHWWAVLRVVG